MEDLRLELRTRNNRLWHLIYDAGETVASFCRIHDYDNSVVGMFLNLSRSPYSSKGVSPTAQRIADTAVMLVEDLFPRELYTNRIPRRLVAEIPSSSYRGLAAAKRLSLPPMQDDTVLQRELRTSMDEVLKTLTPREQRIIRSRFGFSDDSDGLTLEEVGLDEGVSRERIRAIEAKALRKLRHPSRARKLAPFIDGCCWAPPSDPMEPAGTEAVAEKPPVEDAQPIAMLPVYVSQDAVDALLREGVVLLQSMTRT